MPEARENSWKLCRQTGALDADNRCAAAGGLPGMAGSNTYSSALAQAAALLLSEPALPPHASGKQHRSVC